LCILSAFKNTGMKLIKGFILFCFLGGTISGCFDRPDFSNTPQISYERIQFKQSSETDSLILTIKFRDGDGDLGLNDNTPPFNDSFYYLVTGDQVSDTIPMSTTTVYRSSPPYTAYTLLTNPNETPVTGKLVTNKTRNQPNYSGFPVYDPNSCLHYSFIEILVPASFNAVDETYTITDTLEDQLKNKYYLVQEALLYKTNPYFYNIEVRFDVLEGGVYKEFDWFKEFCITFNGRFPFLGDDRRPLEGTIRYGMANPSFLTLFNVKTLRLRIKIRDRARNISNEIETPPFTLTGIK
jgi:hypothetical protein